MFAQSIGLGQLGVGLLVALPQVTKLLCNLPVGYLVDVVGRRPPLVFGAIVDALGQIMTAAASTMTQLVPARLIVGVGSATGGSTGAAATAYQMDVLAKYPEHSGRLLGVIQALGFLALLPTCYLLLTTRSYFTTCLLLLATSCPPGAGLPRLRRRPGDRRCDRAAWRAGVALLPAR